MDQLKATAMIQKLRRRWRSSDSDLGIARRAKRVYLTFGSMYVCMSTSLNLLFRDSSPAAHIVISLGFLTVAIFYYQRSWQFGQISKSLAEAKVTCPSFSKSN